MSWNQPLEKSRSYTMVRGVKVGRTMVDPVLWRKLSSTVTPEDVERLVAHVVRTKGTSQLSIVYGFLTENRESIGNWSTILRQGSIGLTASIGDDARRISWKDGVITIEDMPIPDTMAQALRGQPLGRLIEHPLLPLEDPIAAVHVAGRTTTVTMAVKKVPAIA